MEDILKKLVEAKRRRLPEKLPYAGLHGPRQGAFVSAVREPGISLICEYKKASPSRGEIRMDLSPVETAQMYAEGGARALSVLTEEDFFKGRLEYIAAVREVVDLPILRKDFIFADIQVEETAQCGADCILLIAAVLGGELGRFVGLAHGFELDVLVEVHNADEMRAALATDADMIGINNRDLRTFEVSLDTTAALASMAAPDRVLVSESGVHTRADVEFLETAGVHGILVGESLMRADDIPAKVRELLGSSSGTGC